MTKHDIRDYGAKVDGSTDDTQALRDAVSSASAGDTVYVPSGETRVSSSNGGAVHLDNSHSGITIEGDGKDSVLKLTSGHSGMCSIINIAGDTGVTDLTIRNLTFDGNKSGNSGSNTINVFVWPGGAENDILVEDCWFRNASNTGLGFEAAGCVGRRLTAYDNAKHGFAADTNDAPIEPRVEFRDVLAYNNGIYGVDASGGKTLVENFVLYNNGYGTKATQETVENEYRNGLIRDNDNFGFMLTKTSSSRQRILFDNVVVQNSGNTGLRIEGNADYEIGTLLTLGNNSSGSGAGNIALYDSASVTANEIRSGESASGPGIYVSSGQADISTYIHSGNASSAGGSGIGGDSSAVTVEQNKTAPCEMLNVPSESDVGAGSSSGSGGNSGSSTVGSVLRSKNGVLQTSNGVLGTQ